MAVTEIMWQNTTLGFPLMLEFSDNIIKDLFEDPFRYTSVSLSGSLSWRPGQWAYGVSLGGLYARVADYDSGASAYEWKETGNAFALFAGLSLSNLRQRQHELFGNGFSFSLKGISVFDDFMPRFEGQFRFSIETRFPLNLVLYGAYDKYRMNLQGGSLLYGQPLFAEAASSEYDVPHGYNLTWIAGGEISVGLFSFEIQKNFSHAYFNRIFSTLSLRNVLYDGNNHFETSGIEIGDLRLAQSLVIKFGMLTAFIPLKSVPFYIKPNIWGAWKISDTIARKEIPFDYGFNVNLLY